MIYQPKVVKFETNFESDRSVIVEEVKFSDDCLNIVVTSKNWKLGVHFDAIHGFRVLDEGDLGEFWSECNLTSGWCFEVLKGGWNDLENTRDHFVSGKLYQQKEYLIIGLDECVSVLAYGPPTIVGITPSNNT